MLLFTSFCPTLACTTPAAVAATAWEQQLGCTLTVGAARCGLIGRKSDTAAAAAALAAAGATAWERQRWVAP